MNKKMNFMKFCAKNNIPFFDSAMSIRIGLNSTSEQINELKEIKSNLEAKINLYFNSKVYRFYLDNFRPDYFETMRTAKQLINECFEARKDHVEAEKNLKIST